MKKLLTIMALVCIAKITSAQDNFYPKARCLYQSDVTVSEEAVRLKAKSVYDDSQDKLVFQMSLNDSINTVFEIPADDFTEGAYLDALFYSKIKKAYFDFPAPSINKREIEAINKIAGEKNDTMRLTELHKLAIAKIIQKTANTPRIQRDVILETLKPIYDLYKSVFGNFIR